MISHMYTAGKYKGNCLQKKTPCAKRDETSANSVTDITATLLLKEECFLLQVAW